MKSHAVCENVTRFPSICDAVFLCKLYKIRPKKLLKQGGEEEEEKKRQNGRYTMETENESF